MFHHPLACNVRLLCNAKICSKDRSWRRRIDPNFPQTSTAGSPDNFAIGGRGQARVAGWVVFRLGLFAGLGKYWCLEGGSWTWLHSTRSLTQRGECSELMDPGRKCETKQHTMIVGNSCCLDPFDQRTRMNLHWIWPCSLASSAHVCKPSNASHTVFTFKATPGVSASGNLRR